MSKDSGFWDSEHIWGDDGVLNWDVCNHIEIGVFCKLVDHETVGKDCRCRCGSRVFEPWEMPLTDRLQFREPWPRFFRGTLRKIK